VMWGKRIITTSLVLFGQENSRLVLWFQVLQVLTYPGRFCYFNHAKKCGWRVLFGNCLPL
jgi:hypothetical protein